MIVPLRARDGKGCPRFPRRHARRPPRRTRGPPSRTPPRRSAPCGAPRPPESSSVAGVYGAGMPIICTPSSCHAATIPYVRPSMPNTSASVAPSKAPNPPPLHRRIRRRRGPAPHNRAYLPGGRGQEPGCGQREQSQRPPSHTGIMPCSVMSLVDPKVSRRRLALVWIPRRPGGVRVSARNASAPRADVPGSGRTPAPGTRQRPSGTRRTKRAAGPNRRAFPPGVPTPAPWEGHGGGRGAPCVPPPRRIRQDAPLRQAAAKGQASPPGRVVFARLGHAGRLDSLIPAFHAGPLLLRSRRSAAVCLKRVNRHAVIIPDQHEALAVPKDAILFSLLHQPRVV